MGASESFEAPCQERPTATLFYVAFGADLTWQTFARLAAASGGGGPVRHVLVDAVRHPDTVLEQGITTFPTLVCTANDTRVTYTNPGTILYDLEQWSAATKKSSQDC